MIYRIYIKNYEYDDIFWKVLQMPSNSKQADSLRAVGAFKAPSILIKKGEVELTENYEAQVIAEEAIQSGKVGDSRMEENPFLNGL